MRTVIVIRGVLRALTHLVSKSTQWWYSIFVSMNAFHGIFIFAPKTLFTCHAQFMMNFGLVNSLFSVRFMVICSLDALWMSRGAFCAFEQVITTWSNLSEITESNVIVVLLYRVFIWFVKQMACTKNYRNQSRVVWVSIWNRFVSFINFFIGNNT